MAEVAFKTSPRGILRITLPDGTDLTSPNGGLYAIGSYGTADDSAHNLASNNDDRFLSSPTTRGAPYRFQFSRVNEYTLQVTLDIGPLEKPYKSLSVPLAVRRDLFTDYRTLAASHFHGAGNKWTPKPGGSGRYSDIPLLVTVFDHGDPVPGKVGAARMVGQLPYGECAYAGCTIRRQIVGASPYKEWAFVNHPHSFTNEPSPSGDMSMNPIPLPAGYVFHVVEHLIVTPAGVAPPVASLPPDAPAPPATDPRWPAPRPGAATVAEILDLYRTILRRTDMHVWEVLHHLKEGRSAARLESLFRATAALDPPPSPDGTRVRVTMAGVDVAVASGAEIRLPPLTIRLED